ncbi:hypothetical protein NM208_g6462 [Fusarium decemcellulare]|uniref:Uncharacterized protein n=2 Tax=Fusarium decemcellulare TaxID=57161 RepID=A0ACC1SA23_9HYPO|nr:hypothetical protein NM208_g7262 [Fusarium decemcellulare]KAJ3537085.1 hypothetical protein NM208_g6462 [Fusarium decemcellulare]
MFDVIWTDPDRELVGEHRAKKEKKREQKNKQKEAEKAAGKSSVSIHSARSSTETPFGFLRGRNAKQAKANNTKAKTNSSSLLTPSILSSRSPLSAASDADSRHNSAVLGDVSDVSLEATRAAKEKRSSGPETSQLVQPLGPASYVTKRTEVSWAPRNSNLDDHDMSSEVFISSEVDIDPPVTPEDTFGDRSFPAPLLRPDSIDSLISVEKFTTPAKTPMAITFTAHDPDSWRPPQEWDYLEQQKAKNAELANLYNTLPQEFNQMNLSIGPDLEMLHKEVKRMAAANPSVILSRIKEVWSTADESLHEELEMEKKRWMLSTLKHLDPVPKGLVSACSSPRARETGNLKVLALYESQACHATQQIYHMSAAPLSHAKFPNINPVVVPLVSPSIFPVAQDLFETVYSLSLPAMCPSTDIPGVLRNISKCLRQRGSLQLTLVDPLPCAGTLGHRMRTWLEEHLLINLERQFRCINPSRLFPEWLGDASLRGQGSTLTRSKFYAIPESVRYMTQETDPFIDHGHSESAIKAELRTLVGRMLWMEVWGGFVTGEKWWWEDEGCVEECVELGTFWEYHVIEAIRDTQT